MKLRPTQVLALSTAKDTQGLVGLIGCGHGKTLISFLIPKVVDSRRPLLLVPASLREKTKAEFEFYVQHFDCVLPEILSYESLSTANGVSKLNTINPDIIIADEAHHLKAADSTRTKRLISYIAKNLSTKFFCMSGTLFSSSVADLAHLSELALRDKTPIPCRYDDIVLFDSCLSGEANNYQWASFRPLLEATGAKTAREAIFKRLSEVKGVALSPDAQEPLPSLQLNRIKMTLPPEIKDALSSISDTDNILETLSSLNLDNLDVSMHLFEGEGAVFRVLSQLVCGFVYMWDWDTPDEEWLLARKTWNKLARKIVELDLEGFDSVGLVYSNFDKLPDDVREFAQQYKDMWDGQKWKEPPPQKVVWISHYLVDYIVSWATKQTAPYIIWVDHRALGEELAKRLSIPYFAGGTTPTNTSCICSIKAHGTGKNLQYFSTSLVADTLINATTWEQLLARTHRFGQTADEVVYNIFDFSLFSTCFRSALKQARLIESTTGQPQRLIYGDKL